MDESDAFITPWAPEPDVVIDLVAAADDEGEIVVSLDEEIKAIKQDIKALRAALDRS